MILPIDLDNVQTAHFHVQRYPWLFSILCLWFCSIDPFSYAQFVGYKMISMPTKSGCFLFKWEILHEMPWLCSCLTLAHWSLQIFSSTQELQGINTDVMFHSTSKGKEFSISCPVGSCWPCLTYIQTFSFYHHFASTAHFILNSPAVLHKQQTENLNLGRKCIMSLMRVILQKRIPLTLYQLGISHLFYGFDWLGLMRNHQHALPKKLDSIFLESEIICQTGYST